jgi:quercetin dioxygenase-like cupin family protein
MKILKKSGFSIAYLMALLATSQLAIGQETPPTESKGVTIKNIAMIKLAPEINEIGERQLRLRQFTVEPGGIVAVHNHKDRPAIEYVLQGNVTEYRGPVHKEVKEGESALSDKETTHWWRNTGNVPAVLLVSDVFNPPK